MTPRDKEGPAAPAATVDIGGRRLTLSNLDKILYPQTGFTKAQVVDYYARVAPIMLPHLARRVVTMVRWPNGVAAPSFFEKRCPPHAPAWIHRAEVDELEGCVIDDVATLVWTANLAALELHAHQATVDDPEHPTSMVFDLDPGPPAQILDCARVALELRDHFDDLDLTSVVKTSGGKGLHLAVPVRGATADDTKVFAHTIGRLLAAQHPDRITVLMRRELRSGKVFIDWSQNDRHKTTVCAYSLRGRDQPAVSTPVAWSELEDALARDDADALRFDAPMLAARIDAHGDLYEANLTCEQALPCLG